jgi:hypothetical protein
MIRPPAFWACSSLDGAMTTPTPAELEALAVAIGFLITGSFMRYVWKSPAPNRARKPQARRSNRD